VTIPSCLLNKLLDNGSGMNFHRTAAPSSRVSKSSNRKKSLFSPQKPKSPSSATQRTSQAASTNSIEPNGRLEDPQIVRSRLAPDLRSTSMEEIMKYFQEHMFSPVPNRLSGMSSAKVADILNYRIQLPPLVPVAHVQALASSPTTTEREVASKIQADIVKKVTIPRRGAGSSAFGEALILVSAWEELVNNNPDLSSELKTKYIASLKKTSSVPFTHSEIQTLTHNGLLTSPSTSLSQPFLIPHSTSLGTLTSLSDVGSRHAAGTDAAIGGNARAHTSGGSRAARVAGHTDLHELHVFSLPNTGPFLKLLSTARARLLSLLAESGPYKALPLDRLRERWDGGAIEIGDVLGDAGDDVVTKFKGVLPGKTKKWRECLGLSFEWVLAEALGAGLVECFATGSVGSGVRVV
jgi:hypothetical protein